MWHHTTIESPLGPILLTGSERGLAGLHFQASEKVVQTGLDSVESFEGLEEAARQIRAYFRGELRGFNLRLHPEGTPFQCMVWEELQRIPYGAVISYGELARRIGKPTAARAVGGANGRNPLPVVIPCHRVIAGDGSPGGYTGGLHIKRYLLELESGRAATAK